MADRGRETPPPREKAGGGWGDTEEGAGTGGQTDAPAHTGGLGSSPPASRQPSRRPAAPPLDSPRTSASDRCVHLRHLPSVLPAARPASPRALTRPQRSRGWLTHLGWVTGFCGAQRAPPPYLWLSLPIADLSQLDSVSCVRTWCAAYLPSLTAWGASGLLGHPQKHTCGWVEGCECAGPWRPGAPSYWRGVVREGCSEQWVGADLVRERGKNRGKRECDEGRPGWSIRKSGGKGGKEAS